MIASYSPRGPFVWSSVSKAWQERMREEDVWPAVFKKLRLIRCGATGACAVAEHLPAGLTELDLDFYACGIDEDVVKAIVPRRLHDGVHC